MSFDTNKFMKRMFRRIDGIVWDATTGATGLKTEQGIYTIAFKEDGTPEVTVNPLDLLSLALPGFATQTPHADVAQGDIIVGDSKIIGWVTEKNDASYKVIDVQGMTKNYTPPKVAIMGSTGPLVVRNLFSLAGGQGGVAAMMPMLMAFGGDDSKIEKMLPFFLMQQGASQAAGPNAAANPMAAMLPFLLMKEGGLGGKGGKMDPMMMLAMSGGLGGGGNGVNPMMLMALMSDDDKPATPTVAIPAPTRLGPPPLPTPNR